jgi:hypothetical protein
MVVDCLVEFHDMRRTEAKQLVSEFKANLQALPPEIDRDIVYHDEPFNVACDLAGNDLPSGRYDEQYDVIRDRHYPGWLLVRERYMASAGRPS